MKKQYLIIISIFLVIIVYSFGLPGDFFFDDMPSIVNEDAVHLDNLSFDLLWNLVNSGEAGPFKRPIPVLSFGLNFYFSGLSPLAFKITNIVFHLLNGFLVFFLLKQLFGVLADRKIISFQQHSLVFYAAPFAAMVWLFHPLHVSGVLYIVQRMNIMAGTFTLLACISYCHGRLYLFKTFKLTKWVIWTIFSLAFVVISVLCKENGILAILFILLIEVFFFQFKTTSKTQKGFICGFFMVFFVIPFIFCILFVIQSPTWITGGYIQREFTLIERVLTQSRLLIYYLKLTFLPSLADLSFFHDDIEISKSIFNPITTMLSIATILLSVLIPPFFMRNRVYLSILYFGVLWFLFGHVLESSVFGLEMVYEHRNYVPIIGPIAAVAFVLFYAADKFSIKKMHALFSICAVLSLLLVMTGFRSERWGEQIKRSVSWVQNHPKSYKSHHELAMSYMHASKFVDDEFFDLAVKHYLIASELNPSNQVSLLSLVNFSQIVGYGVKQEWIDELSYRLENKPIHAAVSSQFINLYTCLKNRKCNDSELFEYLIDIGINNKKSRSKNRADLLSIRGAYYIAVKGDINNATLDYFMAVKNNPKEIEHHLSLARCLSLQGKFDEARRAVDVLRQNDKYGKNKSRFDAVSKVIDNDEERIAESDN